MAGLELDIEETAVRGALELGVLSLKMNVRSNTGWPDRQFFIPGGKPLFIEFKQPGEPLDPKQVLIHAQLIARGYDVQTYDNAQDAIAAVQAALDAAPVPEKGAQVSAKSLLRSLVARSRARQNKHNPGRM